MGQTFPSTGCCAPKLNDFCSKGVDFYFGENRPGNGKGTGASMCPSSHCASFGAFGVEDVRVGKPGRNWEEFFRKKPQAPKTQKNDPLKTTTKTPHLKERKTSPKLNTQTGPELTKNSNNEPRNGFACPVLRIAKHPSAFCAAHAAPLS